MLKNTWLFPAVESVHLMGLALAVGTIALLDAGVLGWVRLPEEHARRLEAWTHRGLAWMVLTGGALFFADASRYLHNVAFLVKIALLAAALAFHFTIRRRAEQWGAAVSLALWIAVVVCARLIADFDA